MTLPRETYQQLENATNGSLSLANESFHSDITNTTGNRYSAGIESSDEEGKER